MDRLNSPGTVQQIDSSFSQMSPNPTDDKMVPASSFLSKMKLSQRATDEGAMRVTSIRGAGRMRSGSGTCVAQRVVVLGSSGGSQRRPSVGAGLSDSRVCQQ